MTLTLTFVLSCGAFAAGVYAANRNSPTENQRVAGNQENMELQPVQIDIGDLKSVSPDKKSAQSVVYESVEMRYYENADGTAGSPYIHDVKANNTDKTIVAAERGMLAFDAEGNPLVIDWNEMDSDTEPAYFFLYDWESCEILPYQKDDIKGGWSLDIYGRDSNVADIAYILYCDKKITFEDGGIWENPDFENWRSAYEGKNIEVEELENYYPYKHKIEF